MNKNRAKAAAFAAGVLVLIGCGQRGPVRYEISGTATCNDKPIPIGTLIFNADNKAGNTGPQGRAEVRDGTIKMLPGMGCVGGPHWVQITGFDGSAFDGPEGRVEYGRSLFPMTFQQVDLPRADATIAIRVTSRGRDMEPELAIDLLP